MNKKTILVAAMAISLSSCQNTGTEHTQKDQSLGINLADLDTEVAPCEDFFGFVAGGWIENNPIPATESRWGNFNILIENNYKKLRGLLDSVKRESDLKKGSYPQLVGDFYTSAMDSLAVEKAGLEPVKPLFGKIEDAKTHGDFYALMAEYKLLGLRHPWAVSVGVDDKDSETYILELRQSGLGLPDRDYYLKTDSASEDIQRAYRDHLSAMLQMSGYPAKKAKEAAKGVYTLEKELAEAQMSRVDMRVPENVYNKMSREQVVALAPELELDKYFAHLDVEFDSAVVGQVEYLQSLDSILSETSLPVLQDYARWHALDGTVAYLPHRFVQQDFDFYSKKMQGNKEMKPRWRRTLNVVQDGLGEQLGHLFVDRYFSESSKEAIEQMVEDLRTAYRGRIENLEWMTDTTKEKALEKLEAFKYKIGYPDKWKDYSDLEITDDNYFRNALNVSRYTIRENLNRLGKPVDKDEWFMSPHIANAYYSGSYNEIVFPAGILQPPFYSPTIDDAINYGAIGGVIGHEFTHGFDDRGRKYNAFGNLQNWWGQKDKKGFENRTNKMVVQYSDYQPLKETFVNGRLTLGENIADLGGLTLAYHAYKKSHVDSGNDTATVEGYTWPQRIFIGWGRVWQSNQTDEYTRKQVVTDPHSPAQFRVNGPMSNMPEFRDAWGCNASDPMVRPDSSRVVIW